MLERISYYLNILALAVVYSAFVWWGVNCLLEYAGWKLITFEQAVALFLLPTILIPYFKSLIRQP